MSESQTSELRLAAAVIADSKHLLITAGAGMGADSGLPTYRGNEGFWNLYPPFRRLGLDYESLSTPEIFSRDSELAWGFYGHKLELYRETAPHAGFEILRGWASDKKSSFVFTSNVDGHFQKAGFDPERVFEIHGSIFLAQCSKLCTKRVWSIGDIEIAVDESTMRANPPLPRCPRCGTVARPNVILFGDGESLTSQRLQQSRRFWDWEQSVRGSALVVVELGAGVAIPSVRQKGDQLVRDLGAKLIRINPKHVSAPTGAVVLRCGALEGLRRLDAVIAASCS